VKQTDDTRKTGMKLFCHYANVMTQQLLLATFMQPKSQKA